MKLKSNLLLTDFAVQQILAGEVHVSDGFVEFDGLRIKSDGEFIKIMLLLDGQVACVFDERMVLRNGWSIDLISTISMKIGVKIE